MRRLVFSFAAVVHLLLADQVVKEWAVRALKDGSPVALGPFFNLAYVENRGAAWGMLQGQVWPLAVFGVAALAVLLWRRRQVFPRGFWGGFSELLLHAGIVGNLLDRVFRGHVVDMFDFHWGSSHFPCFNVADSFITVAAAVLIACSLFEKRTS